MEQREHISGQHGIARRYAQGIEAQRSLVPVDRARAVERAAPSIHICFSSNKGVFSRVLRWILRAPISHACLTYRNETFNGKVMVLELQGRGFVSVTWKRWKQRNQVHARYRLRLDSHTGITADQVRNALADLAEWLGTKFDYPSLLGFWLRPLVPKRRVLFNSRRKLVCSGAVALFLKSIGFHAIDDPDTIDPVELYRLIEEHEYLFDLAHSNLPAPLDQRRSSVPLPG